MEEKYKISIIIPTYNVEEKIIDCLDSIFRQTEKQVEVICVDDGSSDLTVDVINAYASGHRNVKLIEQSHEGAGAARNIGIEMASGEYISFLDADDRYYQADALEKMIKACSNQNLMVCGSLLVNTIDGEQKYIDIFPGVKFVSGKGKIVSFNEYQNDFYYQCFLYKRSLFSDKELRFPKYLRYQDPPLFLKIMLTVKQFWVEPVYLYEYCYSENINKDVNSINDVLKGIRDNLKIAVNNDYHILFQRLLERLDNYYYNVILENATKETISLLSEIEKIISSSKWDDECIILDDVIERIRYYKCKCDSNFILEKLLEVYKGKYNTNFVNELKKQKIVVYGVGYLGTRVIDCLKYLGVDVLCALDKNKAGEQYHDVKIISHYDIEEKEVLIIVSLINPNSARVELEGLRIISIIDFIKKLSQI